MNSPSNRLRVLLAAISVTALGVVSCPAKITGISAEMTTDRVVITDDGQPVATYVFNDPLVLRPYLQNVHAPGGVLITRRFPPTPPEAVDHPTIHPGLWLAFGDINGVDFWRTKGRIEHERFDAPPNVVAGALSFRTMNRLVTPSGEMIGRLELAHRITRQTNSYLVTIEAKIVSEDRDLVFGDQKEMGLGVRLTEALIEKSGGRVANSDGVTGAEMAWGKIADWCCYARTLDGRTRGVAVFASPTNTHRSWWHTRDYGLVAANAFGVKAQPAIAEGKLNVPRGTPLALRYAVLLFDTPAATPPDYAAVYRTFAAQK